MSNRENEMNERGLKWWVRHLWIHAIRKKNRLVARIRHKTPVVLEIQSLKHGHKATTRGG